MEKEARSEYPKGIPNIIIHPVSYFNEQVFDGMMRIVDSLRAPFLTYFHLWSPHEPYRPRREFIGAFENDGYSPAQKPPHPYFSDDVHQSELAILQREYDEYIMNVDAEFGRFLDHLEATGLLETSYLFIFSDHGQLFERGIHGHSTAAMYENLLHTPLLISAPGQTERVDVTEPTSNLDLLPTLCALSGRSIPSWAEGRLLPRFGGPAEPRPLFATDAKTNLAFTPLKVGSFVIVREGYKLIRYQYKNVSDVVELYDLNADAEELNDLSKVKPETVNELAHELDEALQHANESFLEK